MNNKGFSLIELLIVIVIIGIIVIIAVPSLLESQKAAQVQSACATLRNIASAQVTYYSKPANNQSYGTAANLVTQHMLDERFNTEPTDYDNYSFQIEFDSGTPGMFTITATPVSDPDSDMPTFYINQRGALYYNNDDPVGSAN